MRIDCPFCGSRDVQEFVYRGSAEAVAANLAADEDAQFAAVYLRDNPAGAIDEYWYHAQGCRTWLVVTRDTRTHAITVVRLTRGDAP